MEPYVPDIYKHIIAVTNRHLCRRPFEEQIEIHLQEASPCGSA